MRKVPWCGGLWCSLLLPFQGKPPRPYWLRTPAISSASSDWNHTRAPNPPCGDACFHRQGQRRWGIGSQPQHATMFEPVAKKAVPRKEADLIIF